MDLGPDGIDFESYFTMLTVPAQEIEAMGYDTFVTSPDKRFIATVGTYPEE